jgi:threonyl-tRNA synthetase
LCRGPHVPSTGKLKVFKLLKVCRCVLAGQTSDNEMLQRVSTGQLGQKKKTLAGYLYTALRKRKNATIANWGEQLDLFHLQDEAPGMVFLAP